MLEQKRQQTDKAFLGYCTVSVVFILFTLFSAAFYVLKLLHALPTESGWFNVLMLICTLAALVIWALLIGSAVASVANNNSPI